ncbi:MAG: class I SAM-dependent methyltransferase [Candidatus Dormibacteraceae bacterium]
MPYQHDVGDFDDRAHRYEDGRRGAMHGEIVERTLGLALSVAPSPKKVLDVGCGTGLLLRELGRRAPGVLELSGIDAAPGMVEVAALRATGEPRLTVRQAVAERLPFDDGRFDLVVSTTSFDHWQDQAAGLGECARVLAPGGRLVLCDQCSPLLVVTLPFGHRGRARTPRSVRRLLRGAGFSGITFHPIYASIIRAATARR